MESRALVEHSGFDDEDFANRLNAVLAKSDGLHRNRMDGEPEPIGASLCENRPKSGAL
jgi:hypothetical protein